MNFKLSLWASSREVNSLDWAEVILSQRSTEWNWKLATTAGDGNVIVLTAIATFLLGDVNQDGFINLIDIQPFVALISGGGFQLDADITPDSVVNLLVAASSGWLTNPRS